MAISIMSMRQKYKNMPEVQKISEIKTSYFLATRTSRHNVFKSCSDCLFRFPGPCSVTWQEVFERIVETGTAEHLHKLAVCSSDRTSCTIWGKFGTIITSESFWKLYWLWFVLICGVELTVTTLFSLPPLKLNCRSHAGSHVLNLHAWTHWKRKKYLGL